jgi:sec-independent protein translocase protein TatB
MFGIGMPEMLLILAVALIVIGPKKLPELAKSLGRAIGEFRKAASDLKESISVESDVSDVKASFENLGKEKKRPAEEETPAPEKQEEKTPPKGPGESPD